MTNVCDVATPPLPTSPASGGGDFVPGGKAFDDIPAALGSSDP